MAGKYPQPSGDEGSRKNRTDRKGKVDRVEKAYVGIVNVYGLVPKGGGAVKIEEFNIPPPSSGAKIYPQTKPPKGPVSGGSSGLGVSSIEVKPLTKAQKQRAKKEIQQINDQKSNAGRESFALIEDKHAKAWRLRKYIGGKADDWVEDIGVYEKWVKANPNNSRFANISRNAGKNGKEIKDSRDVKFALSVLRKKHGTQDFERLLNREAMDLGVSRGRLLQWYTAESMNLDKVVNTVNKREREEIAHKKALEDLKGPIPLTKSKTIIPDIIDIENIYKPSQNTVTIPTQKQLPISPGKPVRKISFSESNNRDRYVPLDPGDIESAYRERPSQVVSVEEGNNVSYFLDMKGPISERKRRLIRSNMKRPRFIFKIRNKANKIVKAFLIKKRKSGKIKCKCRRKK